VRLSGGFVMHADEVGSDTMLSQIVQMIAQAQRSRAPRRPDDADVRERLRELANERRRFGYRRLALMLKRDGLRMNLKKVYRLYKEELSFGLQY
jgi:putative transposase